MRGGLHENNFYIQIIRDPVLQMAGEVFQANILRGQ